MENYIANQNNKLESKGTFKAGKIKFLDSLNFELIKSADDRLNFYVSGEDDKKNNYSLSFNTIITFEEFLKIDFTESVDFIKYIDDGDIVFGYNGVFDLNIRFQIRIIKYLSNKYILNIFFQSFNYDGDDIVGDIELIFGL